MPKLAFAFLFLLALAGLANAQHAEPDRPIERDDQSKGVPSAAGAGQQTSRADSTAQTAGSSSICAMIESAAVANDLPFEFFARVIWQESRLKPDAIGPVTRSGRQAQGIAQFMPMTAAERLLRDPFDPAQALPKSAEFLRELRAQFGNFGLAAAAYNAGPQRVRDWLAGKRTLPSETQAYVRIVTGRAAEEWMRPQAVILNVAVPADMPCGQMAKRAVKLQAPAKELPGKATFPWGVQLIGDRSELKALTVYRQLQKKHEAILGGYEPVVIRTTLWGGALAVWTRVRIGANSREDAEMLCLRLRAVGENCLVQRN